MREIESSERMFRDSEHFAQIVERYKGYVFAIILKFLHDPSVAEDLSQETFLKAYKNLNTLRGDNVKIWIGRIAANTAVDHLRRSRQPMLYLEDLTEEVVSRERTAEELMIEREQKERLQAAIQRLDVKYRECIELYYYQNLSYREIGDRLGLSERSVETRLYRARGLLKDWMEVDCSDERS